MPGLMLNGPSMPLAGGVSANNLSLPCLEGSSGRLQLSFSLR